LAYGGAIINAEGIIRQCCRRVLQVLTVLDRGYANLRERPPSTTLTE